jgi:Flp pilus assembly protein TadB
MLPLDVMIAMLAAALAAVGVLLITRGLWGQPEPAPERPTRRRLGTVLRGMVDGPLLTVRLVGALASAAFVAAVIRWPVAAVATGLLILLWPKLFGARRVSRDRLVQLEALVMWTESLKDLVAGAAGLVEAIPVSVATAHPILQAPLVRLSGRLRARDSLEAALRPLARDLNDPAGEVVVAALVLNAKARGPGLAAALGRLSVSMREELELRQGLNAEQRGDRRTVQLIVVLVVVMMLLMALVLPPQLSHAYRTAPGQLVLVGVFAIYAFVFAWMRTLQQPDVGETFLMAHDERPDPSAASRASEPPGLQGARS